MAQPNTPSREMTPKEQDIQKMLACDVHVGCTNLSFHMQPYVWKRKEDGVHLINIGHTYEKIKLAARIIAAIENPADVLVVSGRTFGQRAVLKFARYTGATAIGTRFNPGMMTNQIQKTFMEPRLLIVTDPLTDSQPVKEAHYVNIPTIALCDTDSPMQFIDCGIPCNNKGPLSIGLIYWLLAREVLYIRNDIRSREEFETTVKPDLFFYRDPEEQETQEEDERRDEDVPPQPAWEPASQTQPLVQGQWTEGEAHPEEPTEGGQWGGSSETAATPGNWADAQGSAEWGTAGQHW